MRGPSSLTATRIPDVFIEAVYSGCGG